MTLYIGIVFRENNKDYSICFPDFPGCVSAAETAEALYAHAREALQFHIDGMVEDGADVPEPMPLDKAVKHSFAKGAVAFVFVEAHPPRENIRINVMMDKELVRRIDSASKNRSAFLTEAARAHLQHMHT